MRAAVALCVGVFVRGGVEGLSLPSLFSDDKSSQQLAIVYSAPDSAAVVKVLAKNFHLLDDEKKTNKKERKVDREKDPKAQEKSFAHSSIREVSTVSWEISLRLLTRQLSFVLITVGRTLFCDKKLGIL